jgi:DeoR/GlpR family transcriptional regulator of sugar metabolism
MLKEERHRRILEVLGTQGRVVAAELQEALGVSGYTIRRDLDELARPGACSACTAGARRSEVARTYEGRPGQGLAGKGRHARAAARVLEPGMVVILDGGAPR